MSCHEWERGTIRIPQAEWAGLKRKVREAWNVHQRRSLRLVTKAYRDLLAEVRGERRKETFGPGAANRGPRLVDGYWKSEWFG